MGASFAPVIVSLSENLTYASPSSIYLTFQFDDAGFENPSGLFRLWTKDASHVRGPGDLLAAGTPFSAATIGLAPGTAVTLYLEAVNPTRRTVHFDPISVTASVVSDVWTGLLVDKVHARGINAQVDLNVDSDNTGEVNRSPHEEAIEDRAELPGVIVPVGGNRAKMVVEIAAGSTARLELAEGAGKFVLWQAATGGTQVFPEGDSGTNLTAQAGTSSTNWTFWIEAIAPSTSLADIAYTLTPAEATGDSSGAPHVDTVRATAVAIDLDVDSDNDGFVQGSRYEDSIEDVVGIDSTPGLYLQVQDEDADGDGLVNWADGFNGLGDDIDSDDLSTGAVFAPLWFRIPEWIYAPDATLEILYSASAPSALVMDPHYLTWDRPSDGHLRIWTEDAAVARSRDPVQEGGDYVAPTSQSPRAYTLAELGLVAGDNKLFLEAIRESTSTAQPKIDFRLTPRIGGKPASFVLQDSVRVTTARIEVMADNRDGTAPFPTFGLTATRIPNPNAGLSGLVPELTQAYTINVYDPRGPETIHTIYVAGTPLPLARVGTGLYSTPASFIAVPEEDMSLIDANEPVDGLLGGPLHPSDVIDGATVVPVSGSSVQIRYNGNATLSSITSSVMELADALFTEVGSEVAESMKNFNAANDDGKNIAGNFQGVPGRYSPTHAGALGIEFEARLHRRFSELAAQGNALAGQFLSGIIVNNATGKVVAQAVEGTTQVDVLFVQQGYVPQVDEPLDRTKVLVYEVKTSASGDVDPPQLNRLKTLTGQPVRSIHSPLKYIANGTGSFKVAQNTRFRAFVNILSNFGKRLPQAVQGLAVATIGLRAMSAEAAIAEEQLEAELEIAITKAHATSDLGKRHGFMLDAWDKTVAILANRGIDLDPSVKSSVVRQILSSTP